MHARMRIRVFRRQPRSMTRIEAALSLHRRRTMLYLHRMRYMSGGPNCGGRPVIKIRPSTHAASYRSIKHPMRIACCEFSRFSHRLCCPTPASSLFCTTVCRPVPTRRTLIADGGQVIAYSEKVCLQPHGLRDVQYHRVLVQPCNLLFRRSQKPVVGADDEGHGV